MQGGKHVILCVDDDQDILVSLRVVLESRGYVVVTAANAADGIEACREHTPDLILIDLMMEDVDSGMKMAERLREAGNTAPMYFLSSSGDYLYGAVDVGDVGVSGVFQKPLQPDILLSLLDRKLGRVAS